MHGPGKFYNNEGTLIYAGGWKDNSRNGQGTLYDKNGKKLYKGEWKDKKRVTVSR